LAEPVRSAAGPTLDDLKEILTTARTIAVVGLSDRPERPSYEVAAYLKDEGYRIIPVNPLISETLGERAYASLHDIRMSYSKRTAVEDVSAIKLEDVDIAKDGNELVLSASYFVKIPLAGNVSLYLDFNPSSADD